MPEHGYIVRESLEVIQQALDLIFGRFSAIDSARAFIRNDENRTILDAIYLRMQMISQKIDRIEHAKPEFFKEHHIDVTNLKSINRHIELNYDELDYELIFDICKNVLPQFQKELKTIQL